MEIRDKKNNFVRIRGNMTESNRHGFSQAYVNESRRAIVSKRQVKSFGGNLLGAFDFETYFDDEGNAVPYSCVTKVVLNKDWKKGDKDFRNKGEVVLNKYYVTDYEDSIEIVIAIISDICKYNRSYWYAHNIGRFDGIFIIKALCEIEVEFKVTWNNDKIRNI